MNKITGNLQLCQDGNGAEESASSCDVWSGGRWLGSAPALPYGVKDAGVAAVGAKLFLLGGLVKAAPGDRYRASAKVRKD